MKELSVKRNRNRKLGTTFGKIILYIILVFSSITMILPFLWMLSSSLKTDMDVFDFPIQWIPKHPIWVNYINIWKEIPLVLYFYNTIKLSVIITFLQLLTSSMAAYAFAKIEFKEREFLFMGYLASMMVPFQVIMIPQFLIMKKLNLVDTHWALILLQAFTPFGVFLLRQFYMSIPNELLDAARIDGLSEFGIYRKIILPLSKPALSALAILTFTFVWNDFLGPLIYINSDRLKTIQLGIQSFVAQYSTQYSLVMAASVASIIPILIIFLLGQKYFIEGIAMSGLKG